MIISFRWPWHLIINMTKFEKLMTYCKMIELHTIPYHAMRVLTIQPTETIPHEVYALLQQIYDPLIFSISQKTVRNNRYSVSHRIDLFFRQGDSRQLLHIHTFWFLMTLLPVFLLTISAAVSDQTTRSTTLWSWFTATAYNAYPFHLTYPLWHNVSVHPLHQSSIEGKWSNMKRLFIAYYTMHGMLELN